MTPVAAPLPKRSTGRSTGKNAPFKIWPVLLGVALTVAAIAIENALTIAGHGKWAMRLLFPAVLLIKQPQWALPEELANNLSQLLWYLQFPSEGLLMALTLRRKSVGRSLFSGFVTHMIVVVVLVVLLEFGHRHLDM